MMLPTRALSLLLLALAALSPAAALLSPHAPPAALQSAEQRELWPQFVAYAVEQGKPYLSSPSDDALVLRRFQAFATSARRVAAHNAAFERGQYSFTLGLNGKAHVNAS